MKTTRFPRLRSLFTWSFRPAHRDASRPAQQRQLRAVERLEDRALLSVTGPYPDMVPTVGVYDENAVQPNTVDVTAAGSSMTAAEFTDRVAAAWVDNSGGVVDGSEVGSAVFGFGQDQYKYLHVSPNEWVLGTPSDPIPVSGSGAFSTTVDGGYNQATILFGVESYEPVDYVLEFGITVLGVNDADYGTVHVIAHSYYGQDVHLTHRVDGTGSEDVFFGFKAGHGDYFGAFSVAYLPDDGVVDKPLWFDDFGFITGGNAPWAIADSYSLVENTTLTVDAPGVLANDSDADSDPLTAVGVNQPAHGALTLNADGSFSYTPDPGYFGTDSFTYYAFDGIAYSFATTVTLDIAEENNQPVAQDDAYALDEDTAFALSGPGVLANDTDPDGDPLSAALITGPSHGTLDLNPDGSFTYTPHADYFGTDSFTYVASDGTDTSNAATVTLSIAGVNDVPVAENDSYSLNEDTPLVVTAPGLQANDSDPDDDPLVARVRSWPSHGTLDLDDDGSFRYTPGANYHGTDSFSYAVRDGVAESNIATVSLEIASVEDTPVTQVDAYTVAEDTALIIPAEVPTRLTMVSETGDFVGQGRTYDLSPSTGSFTASRNFDNGVSIRYTSHTDPGGFWHLDFAAPGEAELMAGVYTGATRFPFQATEDPGLAVFGEGRGCNTLTGEFTVHEVVYGPAGEILIFDASFEQHCEGATPALFGSMLYVSPTLAGVLINDSDGDGDPLTAVLVNGPSHGTLTLRTDGSFDYIPDPDFHGTDSFTYRANDGKGLSQETIVPITVTPVNDPPLTSPQDFATDEDTPLAGILLADDADGDPLTFAIDQAPSQGTVDLNPDGTFIYAPSANFDGTDAFSFTASDGTETSAAGTVSITVYPINDAPVAAGHSVTTEEDTPLTGAVAASDIDGDPLSFVLVEGPLNGTLSLNPDGSFTYAPAADFHGSDSFSFVATDGISSSNVATVDVTVAPVDDAPQIADAAYSIPENSPAGTTVGGVAAGDVDGDPLTYSIVAGNTAGAFAIDPATGVITVADATPLDYETTPQFVLTVEAADPGGLTATAAVTISLTDVVEILPIAIDIRPGDSTNTISSKGGDRVDVAILSTATFDALNVDMETLRFGRTGMEDSLRRTPQGSVRYSISDINGDGLLDLVVEFDRDLLDFHAGDTEGILTGQTLEGDVFAGQDAVTLVGNGWPA